ncbi:MAG TPA: hypothetical protein DDW94_09870 [Deltaproteobacteria bacterium]|nr:MAG: hypothetical protein A2Z79_12465 [Deltaproteobacteria bacterium GWA2_55_82]OGQ63982.1 MAG: hypothetical protein A3I81_07995 [Deltaproteobacteria bacterium RIFCSPLOWO2_02_FULL_55_12]OIJ73415.1 MAG: hypothetical protein A2V21_303535 [Deltaproteobacteria bacterium GWC2_55_46]HBG47278.1 hypothetical protein [Deltaproteobacteria bacterium]HCY10044.1 hypothetical protein [Deltaproteobacteria bacterium]
MKRFALLAFGAKKNCLPALYRSLIKNGCSTGDSLIASFGEEFAAAVEVLGKDGQSVSKAIKGMKGAVAIRSKELKEKKRAPLSNLLITLHGPNREETLYELFMLLERSNVAVNGMEAKTVAEGTLFAAALEAWCPTRTVQRKIKSDISALARSLGLKASVSPTEPVDIF